MVIGLDAKRIVRNGCVGMNSKKASEMRRNQNKQYRGTNLGFDIFDMKTTLEK